MHAPAIHTQAFRLHKLTQACLLAIAVGLPYASVHAAVNMDQSPLILQKPLPPNLVLMLDDSGSMTWNYMPDGVSGTDSAVNGVYYNPYTTYVTPKKADNTDYPNASFPLAWKDGFNTGSGTTNIQQYTSGWAHYKQSAETVGPKNSGNCGSDKKYNCVFKYIDPVSKVEKYVGESCAGFAATNCTTDAATQTNVANWFSYYRTRLLTAKTGLTLAFADLDPEYRFGFASINGRNTTNIPAPSLTYSSPNNSQNKLAMVQTFGDGSSGTQKAKFWTWITTMSGNNGTPLRSALKQVGEYYKLDQPWESDGGSKYACRPAFTILTTDGYWNTDPTSVGVGNVDGKDGPKITTPSTYQRIAAAPFKDSYSDTLADVAMYYWQTDLKPTIDNEVPPTPNNPAYWQHMSTFTLGLGFTPTGIKPSSITIPQIFSWATTGTPPAGVTDSTFSWPKPASDSSNNIADMAHAAVNGRGNFFSAKSPNEFVAGLKSALAAIGDRPGAGNSITQSSDSLPTSASDPFYRFRAVYTTGQWTGKLIGEKYDTTTKTFIEVWDANNVLPNSTKRNIWTSTDGTAAKSVEFKKASDLSSAQQAGLKDYFDRGGTAPTGSPAPDPTQAVLDYLRGDKTYETGNPGGVFRSRKVPLGDIISSTPVFIAKPDPKLFENASFTGASAYPSFVSTWSNRTPLVYLSSNDGMLHAFRAEADPSDPVNKPAGQEVYAYMPAAVLRQKNDGSIGNLADDEYGIVDGVSGKQKVPHQSYNDGRITTQNVVFSDGKWHTVLVGTTGRGSAKTIYALDITDPAVLMDPSKAKNALLWERAADDGKASADYIGQMIGTPVIAQIKQDGATDSTWAVFIGNGYNSVANKAALLQINLETGDFVAHTTDGTADNGLAEPGLVQPDKYTGISKMAYAGDLFGKLWSFDITSSSSGGVNMYVAKDKDGATQPITSLVSLTYDDKSGSTWALFGTGKYISDDDIKSTQTQTWYGLRVDLLNKLTPPPTPDPTPVVESTMNRSNLLERTIAGEQNASDGTINRATSLLVDGDMNEKAGWYLDFSTETGERIVNRTQFIGGLAVVPTLIPKVNDPCNTIPAGAIMLVDPFTGGNPSSKSLLPIGDFNGDGNIDNGDGMSIGGGFVPFNGKKFQQGPAGGVTGVYNPDGTISLSFNTAGGGVGGLGPIKIPGAGAGRVSWRELFN